MIRLTVQQGEWLHDIMNMRKLDEGSPMETAVYAAVREQLSAPNYESDLIELVADVVSKRNSPSYVSGERLEQLRKAVLSPREMATYRTMMREPLNTCVMCGRKIVDGEVCSHTSGRVICLKCHAPKTVTCNNGHRLTLPSHFMKIINKLTRECVLCKQEEKAGKLGEKQAEEPVGGAIPDEVIGTNFAEAARVSYGIGMERLMRLPRVEIEGLRREMVRDGYLMENGDFGLRMIGVPPENPTPTRAGAPTRTGRPGTRIRIEHGRFVPTVATPQAPAGQWTAVEPPTQPAWRVETVTATDPMTVPTERIHFTTAVDAGMRHATWNDIENNLLELADDPPRNER